MHCELPISKLSINLDQRQTELENFADNVGFFKLFNFFFQVY